MVRFGSDHLRVDRSQSGTTAGTCSALLILVADSRADTLAGDVLNQYLISTTRVFLLRPQASGTHRTFFFRKREVRVCVCVCV